MGVGEELRVESSKLGPPLPPRRHPSPSTADAHELGHRSIWNAIFKTITVFIIIEQLMSLQIKVYPNPSPTSYPTPQIYYYSNIQTQQTLYYKNIFIYPKAVKNSFIYAFKSAFKSLWVESIIILN